jgi:hypothetical protein
MVDHIRAAELTACERRPTRLTATSGGRPDHPWHRVAGALLSG